MDENSMHIQPGRSIGSLTLGCSLHEILTTIKADVKAFPRFQLYYDDSLPIQSPIHLVLPDNGLRLQFDGPDQRLRLIEVLDFTKAKLVYKDIEVFKPSDGNGGGSRGFPFPGPSFRHVYDKLLGPTYAGEYIPPKSEDPNARGTYNLSYPGVAFNFPVLNSAYSPDKDFISLLSSSATGPAMAMAVFAGESWQKARVTLFTATPANPRSLAVSKSKEGPDEIELVKVHGQGRLELVRRSSPPFWIILSETTPQDLIMELGAPDSIYRKSDHRLSIHKPHRASDASDLSPGGLTPHDPNIDDGSDHASALTTDEDAWSDSSATILSTLEHQDGSAEHFFNYYHHGFDVFISPPTYASPVPLTTPYLQNIMNAAPPPFHTLTVTKIVLHANAPGSYQFNRYRRSRWLLAHIPPLPAPFSSTSTSHPTSEHLFPALSPHLSLAFQSYYISPEQARLMQRGMPLNRGWGDSPSSSCEIIQSTYNAPEREPEREPEQEQRGRSLDSRRGRDTARPRARDAERERESQGDTCAQQDLPYPHPSASTETTINRAAGGEAQAQAQDLVGSIGNVEIFGFPGLVFEVLKNGAIAALTVY